MPRLAIRKPGVVIPDKTKYHLNRELPSSKNKVEGRVYNSVTKEWEVTTNYGAAVREVRKTG